jgi:predicted nuclease with TOPRIM domain
MADTKVSPFSTIEPGFCAETEEASPRASKERLEYIASYSDIKIKGEDIKEKINVGLLEEQRRGGC